MCGDQCIAKWSVHPVFKKGLSLHSVLLYQENVSYQTKEKNLLTKIERVSLKEGEVFFRGAMEITTIFIKRLLN